MNEYLIKELRTKKGISQDELAKAIGVTRQTLSRWENAQHDDHDFLTEDAKEKMCKVLNCDVEELYNKDLKQWLSVAINEGKECSKRIVGKRYDIKKLKDKGIRGLTSGNRDMVSEAILQISSLVEFECQFYYVWLDNSMEDAKDLAYAFFGALVIDSEK